MLVRAEAKVLDGLAGVLRAAEEHRVRTGRRTHGELVEGEALAACFEDAGAGGAGEAEGGDGELRHFEKAGSREHVNVHHGVMRFARLTERHR